MNLSQTATRRDEASANSRATRTEARLVSVDHAVTRTVGNYSGELINDGERIDREDCIIAATALLNDEPVITRNTTHFDRIDGLEIRSY